VVEKARQVGVIIQAEDRSSLIAADCVHDIGYAPALQRTGFHPLDGAFYLHSCHQDRLVSPLSLTLFLEAEGEDQNRSLAVKG
jgi:hypothetical protein